MVFPWERLRLFTADELQQMLWSDLEWDEEKLERIVRAGSSWPQDWDQIRWLRAQMLRMDTSRRRAFIKFVTASVCMPLDDHPIVVQPQVRAASYSRVYVLPPCALVCVRLCRPPPRTHVCARACAPSTRMHLWVPSVHASVRALLHTRVYVPPSCTHVCARVYGPPVYVPPPCTHAYAPRGHLCIQ